MNRRLCESGAEIVVGGAAVVLLVAGVAGIPSARASAVVPTSRSAFDGEATGARTAPQAMAAFDVSRLTDPDRTLLPERCGECHFSEYDTWKSTEHATGFDTMHRRDAAERIIGNLDLRLVKRDSPCLACHYTPQRRDGQLRAAAGVSCESCHGAAQDWVDVHNDFGVAEPDLRVARAQESDAHRAQRIAASSAAGMLRPSDPYAVMSRCFDCHAVPDERLVNVGQHGTGSADFELTSWLEPVRHNFLESFLTGDGRANTAPGNEQQRRFYVLGRGLAVEHGLRAVAGATEPTGRYFRAAARRLDDALDELAEVEARAGLPLATEILAIVAATEVRAGAPAPSLEAAARIGELLAEFGRQADTTGLAALDPLIEDPGSATRIAEAVDLVIAADPLAAAAAAAEALGDAAGTAADGSATPDAAETPTDATAPAGAAAPAISTETATVSPAIAPVTRTVSDIGEILTWPPWRDRPAHRNLPAGTCGGCHGAQDAWWFDDPHGRATDPFFERNAATVAIARTYGIDADQMTRGDQFCMQCHGFVASGREAREADGGVECQSCHGPGEAYRGPHENDYASALTLGMVDLRVADTRARACADCHYVTDARLLSAGHPDGASFDLAAAIEATRHWEGAALEPADLASAWAREIARRGPIPSVPVYLDLANPAPRPTPATPVINPSGAPPSAGPAQPVTPPTPAAEAASGAPSATRSPTPRAAAEPGARQPAPAAVATGPPTAPGPVDPAALAPLVIDPDAPVSEILLRLRARLELLYRLLGRPPHQPSGDSRAPAGPNATRNEPDREPGG